MGKHWTTDEVPDQTGRTAIITGANTGLGFETASVLAAHGAHVVLAVRDTSKGDAAARRIEQAAGASGPKPSVAVQALDLTSLESVSAAADALRAAYPRIDLLINNAGVMYSSKGTTKDGFELQLGTNHLGHFALTGQLLENLYGVEGARVVTLSSVAHRVLASIDFDDLMSDHRYNRFAAYGRSKLANLLFTYGLQRKLVAAGKPAISVAAHPGMANTELPRSSPPIMRQALSFTMGLIAQAPAQGALPTLRAATDPTVLGGQFYGPGELGQTRGAPVVAKSSSQSHDEQLQDRMWQVSEKLTGVTFPV